MMKLIDANDPAAVTPGYMLFVFYAPGAYRPFPSIFTPIEGQTTWGMHCTALYEAVEYVEEMTHRRLADRDSMIFIRNHEGIVVWKNDAMRARDARVAAALAAE